jgi:hypothetical protein
MQSEAATATPVPLVDTAAELTDLPPDEFKKFIPAFIADFSGWSDAELEEDFVMFKQAIMALCARGMRGEDNPGDIELTENTITMARCILAVAYPRGLQWALDEEHKTRPMSTC